MLNPLFSPEDSDLALLKWHKHTCGYANRWFGSRSESKKLFAHRIVLERKIGRPLKKGEVTDHINRNKLDNRRDNLRVADKSLNTINRDLRPDNSTGYVGVYLYWPKEWRERGWAKRWSARIERHGKIKSVGYFTSSLDAHLARQAYLRAS